jgi:hypothetical protein
MQKGVHGFITKVFSHERVAFIGAVSELLLSFIADFDVFHAIFGRKHLDKFFRLNVAIFDA